MALLDLLVSRILTPENLPVQGGQTVIVSPVHMKTNRRMEAAALVLYILFRRLDLDPNTLNNAFSGISCTKLLATNTWQFIYSVSKIFSEPQYRRLQSVCGCNTLLCDTHLTISSAPLALAYLISRCSQHILFPGALSFHSKQYTNGQGVLR